jgi:hypothetical protein
MNPSLNSNTTPETAPSTAPRENRFDWPVCSEAEALLLSRIDAFLAGNRFANQLAEQMRSETGTLLLDWVDHLVLPAGDEPALRRAGFTEDPLGETANNRLALHHPDALLPRVLLADTDTNFPVALVIRAESLADFMGAHALTGEPEGEPFSRFRRLPVSQEIGTVFEAVERRGYRGFVPAGLRSGEIGAFLKARELWHARRRAFADDTEGYAGAHALLDRIIAMVGRDLACHVVFEGERAYWQRRNRAAQIQKQRQDRLGLGWANHDHHTFRSSRRHFLDLMRVMDKLGFERRERYYAGAQAGWGAQILEQPVEGIVVFADVDLMPEETGIDFSRQPLPPQTRLGTIGLWVGLHGESFLEAGMHHLEARFDFALVRRQLESLNVAGMAPFSDFEFLKQAFTEGERWPVRRERAEKLRREGLIADEQLQRFLTEGAIGSHLETLQRRGGFKGFNQKSVSAIIAATDPRNQPARRGEGGGASFHTLQSVK